jgi:hypothetical protein
VSGHQGRCSERVLSTKTIEGGIGPSIDREMVSVRGELIRGGTMITKKSFVINSVVITLQSLPRLIGLNSCQSLLVCISFRNVLFRTSAFYKAQMVVVLCNFPF